MADPVDGLNRTATDNLLAWSRTQSCGQMVLALAPVFIGAELDTQALADLADRGVETLWAQGKELHCSDPQALLELIPDSGYTKK
jgi:hypothetical protein